MTNIENLYKDYKPFLKTYYDVLSELGKDFDDLQSNFYEFRYFDLLRYNALQFVEYLYPTKESLENLIKAFIFAGTRNSLIYACRALFGDTSQLINFDINEFGVVDITINNAGEKYEYVEVGTDDNINEYKIVDDKGNNILVLLFEKINYNPSGLLTNFMPSGFRVGTVSFVYQNIQKVIVFKQGIVTINNYGISK